MPLELSGVHCGRSDAQLIREGHAALPPRTSSVPTGCDPAPHFTLAANALSSSGFTLARLNDGPLGRYTAWFQSSSYFDLKPTILERRMRASGIFRKIPK